MKEEVDAIISYMIFLVCVFFGLFALYGCSPKLADISIAPAPVTTCPSLALPPVPSDVVLDISGDKVTANEGGATILRGYVQARSLLRPAAHAK